MSEILATIGLLGIGYLITNKKEQEKKEIQEEKKETFMNNTLSQVIDGEKIEQQVAKQNNAKKDYIASTEKPFKPDYTAMSNELVSSLSGLKITKEKFKTRSDGQLMNYLIVRSSSNKILDKAAIDAVKNARPYPDIPKLLKLNSIRFKVPISFMLNKP